MSYNLSSWWLNFYGPDDKRFLSDDELISIDEMEDSITPLDEQTIQIRQVITRFEACYHEADKQAELIIKAIGSGTVPEESDERPPQRKRELQNAHDILVVWCEGTWGKCAGIEVGAIGANELVGCLGEPTALKIWQVQRIVDKVSEALDPSCTYHRIALDLGDYGEPGAVKAGDHYKDQPDFIAKTKATVIHDTRDGKEDQVSLAIAIDLLEPCCWNFVGNLAIILKAIGGDLRPGKPLALCQRNIKLSPLCDRLRTISNTLSSFWKGEKTADNIDSRLLASLGEATPVKRWLAASLDKTIRLHLSLPFEIDLS